MNARRFAGIERDLSEGPEGRFTDAEFDQLPDPVRRYFQAAVAPRTPLARSVRIDMRGHIKVGRWLPFRASEVLAPGRGFIWAARAAGLISGYDRYVRGIGEMDWRLAGFLRVMHVAGPDVSRSAAERAAAEAVRVPTALLPRFGVEWTAGDDTHISSRFIIDDRPVRLEMTVTGDGCPESVVFGRWGDPDNTGTFGIRQFGGAFEEHATFHGLTIPVAGRMGWHYGTERWADGEFFRYRITDLVPLSDAA